VKEGNPDILLQSLAQGADINEEVGDSTALIAAARGGHKDVVSLLLDLRADVNKEVGDTMALIEAVKNGHEDVLSLLLDRGADVNMALLVAAMEGYWMLLYCYWTEARILTWNPMIPRY